MKQQLRLIIQLIICLHLLSGCSLSISNFSEDINKAVKANDDPQTIKQALPAYLILLDALLEADKEDVGTLISSSRLLNAYAGLLGAELESMSDVSQDTYLGYEKDKIRLQQKKLTIKALKRAAEANCYYEEYLCDLTTIKYLEFEKRLTKINEEDIAILYSLGTAWATWVQNNSDDWNAMAQVPQIKLIMQKVVEIDEKWDNAGAHMYLGVLNSLIPASLGGKPEQGKANFERSIKLTQGENLMAKVLFAEYYARLTFDKELHNQLIEDVLNAKSNNNEFILINTLAIQKAKALQASGEDYF